MRLQGSLASESLGANLKDHIERCLGCPAEALEARLERDLAQPVLAGLSSEPQPHLLGERCRRADEGRRVLVAAPDWIEVVLQIVAGNGLDDHP